jgi:hypothetical protein
VLPWATLGLQETDRWGQRFTYQVSQKFFTPPGFTLNTTGDITVKDGNSVTIATKLPAIVISHGRNGLGSYGSNGKQRSGAANLELTNTTGSGVAGCDTTYCFFSQAQAPKFDDELIWIPLPILMNRMVTAGRLP